MTIKIVGDGGYAREDIQRVLDSPIPYTDTAEEEATEKLFALLNEEQIEAAAQSSYAYWRATLPHGADEDHNNANQPQQPFPTAAERVRMAKRECRRHVVQRSLAEAFRDIEATLQYRREYRVDLLRAAFDNDIEILSGNDDDDHANKDAARAQQMAALIRDDLGRQAGWVVHGRGRSEEGAPGGAVLILRARHTVNPNKRDADQAFVWTVLYLMERAIACTEAVTHGAQEKIVVVLDFGNFSSALAPSLKSVQRVAKILQHRYTERLYRLIVMSPPWWMRTLYAMVKPKLDPVTRAKFVLAAGDRAQRDALALFLDADQVNSFFLLPEGKVSNDVDIINVYLQNVPFQMAFSNEQATGKMSSTRC